MTASYLLTLRPMEAYFFGNEKTFAFESKNRSENRYFIKSEQIPMQTTILGALRYLLMPVKHADFRYTPEENRRNARITGGASFDIAAPRQSFGAIGGISPVFLTRDGRKYVHTPFDHTVRDPERNMYDRYTPFSGYISVETDRGTRWVAPGYRSKDGIAESFMDVQSGGIVSHEAIFGSEIRVGLGKNQKEKAFFKKQFARLEDGWAFAVYVDLDLAVIGSDPDAGAAFAAMENGTIAYLGQSKSAFSVQLTREENTIADQIGPHLGPGVCYCFGDAWVPPEIYENCLFAAAKVRDYRVYRTTFQGSGAGRICKDSTLYKLLRAGSVLIPSDRDAVAAQLASAQCTMIGFNVTVSNREDPIE